MKAEDKLDLNAINALYRSEPHRITAREAFRSMFKQDRNPWTGEPLGPPYLNPIFRAGLEQQGHDADKLAQKMEQQFRDQGIWPAD